MSLQPLAPNLSVLRPLALWCLDTFGEDAPMLVGIQLADEHVRFHPVQLSDDPLDDLAGLAAPSDWDVAVVVAHTETINSQRLSGTIAHAVDRFGSCATELDDDCGRRRSLRTVRGSLHSACLTLFVGPLD